MRRFIPTDATAAVAAGAEGIGGFDFVNAARMEYKETEIDEIPNTVRQAKDHEYRLPVLPALRGATPTGFNSSTPRNLVP